MSKQNKTEKATTRLEQKLKELTELLNKKVFLDDGQYHYFFARWRSETEYTLIQTFGEDSRELNKFENAATLSYYGAHSSEYSKRRRETMERAAAEIEAILSARKEYGIPERQEPRTSPKVFIAHGGETEALSKLQSFLGALGIIPLVAEDEASEDRSVDAQVEWCLANADCVIILGTADDQNLKDGKLYPRPNVCIEIGRVQERFPGRVIYLLEQGASFPSNITEKVYERFTQENMEKAFSKAAKELKAFGIIRATTIKEP